MFRFVLSLGIVAIVAGVLAILFGIPIKEFGLGNTLIHAGATVLSSGFIVTALAMVLRALDRMAADLRAIPAGEPRVGGETFERQPALPPPDWPGGPPAADDWRRPPVAPPREEAPVPERVRPPLPSPPPWSGRREEEAREPGRPPAPPFRPPGAPPPRGEREPVPRARPSVRAERPREPLGEPARMPPPAERMHEPGGSGEELAVARPHDAADAAAAPPEKRRVFGWTRRSKGRREDTDAQAGGPGPPSPGGPDFGGEAGRSDGPMDAWEPPRPRAPSRREAPAGQVAPAAPRPGQEGRPAQPEVLKSGTIDGMSYTLYTDGSIDAEFPEGRIRFASIEALRRHLETQA